ncbi:MAG: tRNA 4-thiouridine(8) synthase ThiI [Candidatus Micrarchaeota archaeon]|nr:tRNA 4-thiouridine(8) synthase ThiI [Candidatus Micrarchaeota archaeon]MDE1824170.1 tRNA 4-thiouridine(8) synthase ThiI [Candidatus Micrarchaeota archaeon]MDE1849419.1 tRNA 4-thiouridine(8) synthase ThiI [Candidatus Micrarchaeota archaeon]
MKHDRLIVVHFGELWLRGKNRNEYVKTLLRNIREELSSLSPMIERNYDRISITPRKESDIPKIKQQLSKIFGISNYKVSYKTKATIASISSLSEKLMKENSKEISSLRIEAHRSYKEHKFKSVDVVKALLKKAEKLGMKTNPRDYDTEMSISVTKDYAFISMERTKALKGLPVGTSGKGVVLLSGGIDSPVAAWYAMKRGIVPVYVHVHPFAKNSEALASKIPRIISILSEYHPHYKAYFVPAGLFQIKAAKTGRYELILLKAFMLGLAARIAELEDAKVIYTGESLGQVASQTPHNLLAAEMDVRIPVLRPLIGMDKEEIISVAKRIGTYEESIKEYSDVCSINARNPPTRMNAQLMDRLKLDIGLDRIIESSLAKARKVEE